MSEKDEKKIEIVEMVNLEEEINPKEVKKLLLIDLYQNVIIYNILPFLVVTCRKDLDFWGYFKRDKSRNIVFIFRSISIYRSEDFRKFVISFPQIHFLRVGCLNMRILSQMKGMKFLQFRKIEMIVECSNHEENYPKLDLFFNRNYFKQPLSVGIWVEPLGSGEDLPISYQKWNIKMREIKIQNYTGRCKYLDFEVDENFFHVNEMSHMEKLTLRFVVISKEFQKFERLRTIHLGCCDIETDYFLNESSGITKLESLTLTNCRGYFLNNEEEGEGEDGTIILNKKLAENLKLLEIRYNQIISPFFFKMNNFKNLESLNLCDIGLNSENWLEFPLLKTLVLNHCVGVTDEVFQSACFPILSNLKLVKQEKIVGCFSLPLLRSLALKDCKNFKEEYFHEVSCLGNLETLKLSKMSHFTGEKWVNIENLDLIYISRCENFSSFLNKSFVLKVDSVNVVCCEKISFKDFNYMDYLFKLLILQIPGVIDQNKTGKVLKENEVQYLFGVYEKYKKSGKLVDVKERKNIFFRHVLQACRSRLSRNTYLQQILWIQKNESLEVNFDCIFGIFEGGSFIDVKYKVDLQKVCKEMFQEEYLNEMKKVYEMIKKVKCRYSKNYYGYFHDGDFGPIFNF